MTASPVILRTDRAAKAALLPETRPTVTAVPAALLPTVTAEILPTSPAAVDSAAEAAAQI